MNYLEILTLIMDYDWLGGKMENFTHEGDSLDSDIYDKDNLFFEDLKTLRSTVPHDQKKNFISIDSLETKDLMRETKSTTSLRVRKLTTAAIGSLLSPLTLKESITESGLSVLDLHTLAD